MLYAMLPCMRRPAGDRAVRLDRVTLALLIVATCVWGSIFIARSSFRHAELLYFSLFDDAMISMAFARNLASGEGLVWSPGSAPVEGFTNPLWTGGMALFHLVPVAPRFQPLLVQVVSLVLLLVLLMRVRALVREHFATGSPGPAAWLPAAVLTATQYHLLYWSLLGMEVALQALLAVLAVHFAYDIVFAGRDRHLALFAVFALAYLTRMDMAILVAVTCGWVAWQGGFQRAERRSWLVGAGLLLVAVVGYQAFRLAYFGSWLPNTYYLKVDGIPLPLRLSRGLAKMLLGLADKWPVWLLVLAGGLTSGWRRSRSLLPVTLLAVYLAYSVWVGGDAWELPEIDMPFNRFVVFLLPLAFVVIGDLLWRVAGRIEAPIRRRLFLAGASVVLIALSNGLLFSPRRGENLRRSALLDRPLFVDSHALVLANLRRLEELVAPGAEVVTYWAGIPAYFSRFRPIDAMGYADRHIARRPLRPGIDAGNYVPGHQKRDPAYLLARRPDAFFQFWDLEQLPVRWPRHHMRWRGYVQVGEFWLRRDSPYLRPDALPPEAPRSR
jgi:hypothetical protein